MCAQSFSFSRRVTDLDILGEVGGDHRPWRHDQGTCARAVVVRAGARRVFWLLRSAANETPLCAPARAADDDVVFRPPSHARWCATADGRLDVCHDACHQQIRYSYRELRDEADRAARALIALGVQRGDRVGIWSHNAK